MRLTRIPLRLALVFLVVLAEAGCGSEAHLHEVTPIPDVPPLNPAQTEAVGTLALAGVLQVGEGVEGGFRVSAWCAGPVQRVPRAPGEQTITDDLQDVFISELGTRLGFRVVGNPDDLFGRSTARAEAEFQLAARIRSLRFDLCHEVNILGLGIGSSGAASGEIMMQLLDQKTGQVVYETRVTAAARLKEPVNGWPIDLLRAMVFRDALRRLAADNGFRRALISGLPTSDALRQADRGYGGYRPPAPYAPPARFAATGGLQFMGPPLFAEPLALNINRIRAATVTVLGMASHGSGFFITNDGWVLTNNHVIEDSDVFRLQLVDGREVWARVERRHPQRDVALLKAVGQGFEALPLRPTLAQISETTFAIGTPQLRSLGQTVSQGIISAYRPGGPGGMDLYQATTPIHGGNSGGPLVDAWGNVIAISESIITNNAQGLGSGLGFFIPIHDALRFLGVQVVNPMPGVGAGSGAGPGQAPPPPAPSIAMPAAPGYGAGAYGSPSGYPGGQTPASPYPAPPPQAAPAWPYPAPPPAFSPVQAYPPAAPVWP